MIKMRFSSRAGALGAPAPAAPTQGEARGHVSASMRLAPVFGALLPLLAGCGLFATPSPPKAAAPPAAARPPEAQIALARRPAEEIALSFDRGLWHMEGIVTLPERVEGAKVPAAVIVHGSGPMSRDGFMRGQIGLGFGFDMPVYKQLAEALTARGYAVYRYDKRSCGSYNGCKDDGPSAVPYSLIEAEFSTSELVGDALAALDTLAQRPEIDAGRLFFVGHSEGGELVPLLLSERPGVRAGVMLAPPFNTMGVVLEQQSERVRWAFTAAGQPEQGDAEGRKLLDAAIALRHVERGTHFGEPILGQPAGIWASWIDLARKVPDIARKLDRPLLVLGGSYDYNVAPSEIESWARWLAESPRVAHRVRVIECVTHALNCIAQSNPTRITEADIGHDVSPEIVGEVARFLEEH
jgi:pimeloyl-ACP methyl ester carboxylesterase